MSAVKDRPPAIDPAGQTVWQHRMKRSGFFLAALLLHLILFWMLATWVIFRAVNPPQDASFGKVAPMPVKIPPPPAPPASGDTANNPEMEPQPVVVPVVTPPVAITSVNSSITVDTSKVVDQTLSHLPSPVAPQGTGLGTAGASGPTGPGNDYGSGSGSPGQMVGHLYDLKQTPERQPTNIMDSATNGLDFLRTFVKDWNMATLANYYEAPGTLYASQICIRERHSDESTKAFGVSGIVDPKRWIVVYDATITPPDSGTYRFVGWADDFLVVRWNGANVLDASYDGEGVDPSANAQQSDPGQANKVLKYGKWIQMDPATPVPMKILIGEGPGGYSGFILMIQKQGDDSPSGDYPLFQVQDAKIPDFGGDFTFTKKKMLFQAQAPQ